MNITYTQCKQIAQQHDMRDYIAQLTDLPAWLEYELSIADIQAIQQGGCASGAYMPAVTYHIANETMAKHGDSVLDYIAEQTGGETELPASVESWTGIAVFYLSYAVELWAGQFDLDGVNWD